MRSPRFWLPLLVILGLNILVANVFFPPSQPVEVTVPYNVFLSQVRANNVASITSTGSLITVVFRHPSGASPQSRKTARHFQTELPTFAGGAWRRCSRPIT